MRIKSARSYTSHFTKPVMRARRSSIDQLPHPVLEAIETIFSKESKGYDFRDNDPRFLGESLAGNALIEAELSGRSRYRIPDYIRAAKFPEAKWAALEAKRDRCAEPMAAIFDVDRTITDDYLGLYFFHWLRYTDLAWRTRGVYYPQFLWNAMRLPLMKREKDYIKRHELGTQALDGLSEVRVQYLADVFAKVVTGEEFNAGYPFVLPRALERIRWHDGKGHVTALASGSSFYAVKALADRLGVDFAMGARTLVDGRGIITGTMSRPLVLYSGKAELVHEYLRVIGIQPHNTYTYTDDLKVDFPFFNNLASDATRYVSNYPWALNPVLASGRSISIMRFDGQQNEEDAIRYRSIRPRVHARRKAILFREATKIVNPSRTTVFFRRLDPLRSVLRLRTADDSVPPSPPHD